MVGSAKIVRMRLSAVSPPLIWMASYAIASQSSSA